MVERLKVMQKVVNAKRKGEPCEAANARKLVLGGSQNANGRTNGQAASKKKRGAAAARKSSTNGVSDDMISGEATSCTTATRSNNESAVCSTGKEHTSNNTFAAATATAGRSSGTGEGTHSSCASPTSAANPLPGSMLWTSFSVPNTQQTKLCPPPMNAADDFHDFDHLLSDIFRCDDQAGSGSGYGGKFPTYPSAATNTTPAAALAAPFPFNSTCMPAQPFQQAAAAPGPTLATGLPHLMFQAAGLSPMEECVMLKLMQQLPVPLPLQATSSKQQLVDVMFRQVVQMVESGAIRV